MFFAETIAGRFLRGETRSMYTLKPLTTLLQDVAGENEACCREGHVEYIGFQSLKRSREGRVEERSVRWGRLGLMVSQARTASRG